MRDSYSSSGDDTRAALSGSRSTSLKRASTYAQSCRLDRPASMIVIKESISNLRYSSLYLSTTPKVFKVAKIDLLGEPSSDSSSGLRMSSDDREDVNNLLSPGQYIALPATHVPRDHWIPGYSCRVRRSTFQVSPWSSRQVSYTSVAELEVELMVKHFFKSKYFPLPAYKVQRSSTLRANQWAP